MTQPLQDGHSPPMDAQNSPDRRNFLTKAAAVLVGGVITLVPTVLGAMFVINPLRKKSSGGESENENGDGFVQVGTLGSMVPGGPPQLFQVKGVKVDAWTTYPLTELGAVYVRLVEDGTPEGKLACFNARCPHLGCTVNYRPERESFICPCHDSAFTLDGERSNDIPPRDMDPLDIEIRNGNQLWVRFRNFRAGQEERLPIA